MRIRRAGRLLRTGLGRFVVEILPLKRASAWMYASLTTGMEAAENMGRLPPVREIDGKRVRAHVVHRDAAAPGGEAQGYALVSRYEGTWSYQERDERVVALCNNGTVMFG